jgi:hypothetical protein
MRWREKGPGDEGGVRATPSAPARALLPFSRWREKGPGDEGGDRANPTAPARAPPLLPLAGEGAGG